jgi:lipopolysaccharide biosynthesis protein
MGRLNHLKHQARRVIGLTRRTRHSLKTRLSVNRDYIFNLDSPRKRLQDKRSIHVEGWIIPKTERPFKIRIRNNERSYKVKTGIKRLDVTKTHPNIAKAKALHSGFAVELEFEDGDLTIEIDAGKGYKKLYSTDIAYGIGDLPKDIYNKDLSNNYPEHINLLENRKTFYYEDEAEVSYKRHEKDARLVAMYLPQFHPFTENDKAWGKGFTEWTNVAAGVPRFIGHQQPVLSKDLGFYDLRLESKILEQIELAKKHGVYGFSFYYYWFSGKKIMDGPLNSFLKHQEWDFNFTICWANENWTKRWDGRDTDVIIAQQYREEDPLEFIKEVEHILLDKRYITENGKIVLSVYRASELKDPIKYAEVWRAYFREKHNKELQLVSYLSFDDRDPRDYGFDAALDFAPLSAFFKHDLFDGGQFPFIDIRQKLLDINFSGIVADYRSIALNDKLEDSHDFPTYPCVTPSWDNDARKKGKGFVYQNSSPDLYASWLGRIVTKEMQKKEAPLIFVNAWNEWAEGAILEPSAHMGHAVLNRTAEVISKHSFENHNKNSIPPYGIKREKNKKIAVVVHLFYTDMWSEINAKLALISEPFDLFVTLNQRDKSFASKISHEGAKVFTYIVPNRGRDVLPFLFVARRLRAAGYEYVLKLHSKRSKHRLDGSNWFNEVLDGLLSDEDVVEKTIELLGDETVGVIGPENHLVSLKRHMGSNKLQLKDLLVHAYSHKVADDVLKNTEVYPYIGGTMFWARIDVFDDLLGLHLMPDDFSSEHGQIDGTMAHAVERFIGVSAKVSGKQLYLVSKNGLNLVSNSAHIQKYDFAP